MQIHSCISSVKDLYSMEQLKKFTIQQKKKKVQHWKGKGAAENWINQTLNPKKFTLSKGG